jgi:hypothetical protein
VLLSLQRPGEEIRMALDDIRTRRYSLFRPDVSGSGPSELVAMHHEVLAGVWFIVTEQQHAASIGELDIRRRTGATIVAIRREENMIVHPVPEEILKGGDQVYVSGNAQQLANFEEWFQFVRFCPISERTSNEVEVINSDEVSVKPDSL